MHVSPSPSGLVRVLLALLRRVKLARLHVAAIRDALRVFQGESSTPTGGDKQPVAEWLPTYGTDPYYPSKRIRRITERVYYQATIYAA